MESLVRKEQVILYILICATLLGCSNSNEICYKKAIVGNEFEDVSGLTKGENVKFKFTDSSQITYENGKLYAEATVIWRSCSSYDLIVRKAYYTDGLKVGDTLKVDIQSLNVDTFFYVATAYGLTLSSKFKKIK
jgi:hypothetical protein